MLSQVAEKKMHIVRWLLAVGWLTLIFSLLYDPISPWFTDPSNLSSPFHLKPEIYLDPEQCVKVQGVCLPEQPYGMGARIFWAMVLPIGIMILLVFGHEFWRRICPLYFFSQIPRALGIQRKRKVVNPSTGSIRYELAGVEKDSWLGRNYLYLQVFLFYLGLNIRLLFVNGDRLAMAIFLLLTISSAILVGFLLKGRSWCQYFCPMAPVQMFYTGPRGLLGSEAHQSPPQSVTQSTCRTVDSSGKEKSACVSCQSPCIDIDAERSYWDGITRPDQKLVFYTYFGLMLGFYFFYFLYSGNWDYYYSGAWTHEEGQLSTLLKPGFYIFNQAIPIPKLIAAPLTLAFFAAASYFICLTLERAFRSYLKQTNKSLSEEKILHICFVLCVFASFNVFFMFGGRPNISLLPNWAVLVLNGIIILVSSLWLYRSLSRSKERYSRESLASSLRRQLDKLSIDWPKFLEGRSLKDLIPDEVYVLAKVLPGFSRTDRQRVYKGVLQEALEDGNVHTSNSLEVLKDVRKELSVSDDEHYTLLAELGVEDPSLLDPQKQLTRETRLRIEGYRRALELLILELVESGISLQEAFERKQKQIMALRQEYAITADEQEQVLAELFNEDGVLLRTAEVLLSQLQDLAVYYQALHNLVPNRQAPVYVLLRSTVEQKEQLITVQLLSIVEILGDSPGAMNIASSTGLLAPNVVEEMLRSDDEQSKWQDRLSPKVISLLRQAEDLPTQISLPKTSTLETQTRLDLSPTQLGSPEDSTQIGLPELRPRAIIDVLLELLQDLDPLVQAASLYALHQLDPTLGSEQARQLMSKQNIDWLVRETAEIILGQNKGQTTNVPTLIAQVKAMGRTEQRLFQQPIIRVGRGHQNDIVILDNRVSREHAIFYLDEQGVSVKDLNSANGLRIGSETIRDQRRQLKRGDIVRLSTGEQLAILVDWKMQPVQTDMTTDTLGTLEKLLWLYKSSFFQGMKANALIELARNTQVRVYRQGEEICKMGEPVNEILVLIDGEAQARLAIKGKEQILETVSPGQTIGELGVLTHKNRSATLIATRSNTRALAIDAKNFEAMIRQDPLLAKNLLVMVTTRLQETLSQASPVALS
jgi:pSer/pThr/pTyr-binding forkhead associated (FHA) protein